MSRCLEFVWCDLELSQWFQHWHLAWEVDGTSESKNLSSFIWKKVPACGLASVNKLVWFCWKHNSSSAPAAGGAGEHPRTLGGFPNLSRAGKTNPCTLRSAVCPSVCVDRGQHRSPEWTGERILMLFFPNSLQEQLCWVFFTKSIPTAWEHWHCSFQAAWQSQSVQASSPERGRGSSPDPWQSTPSISGSKASLGGFSWSWLQHKGFSELLGFLCSWLVPILFSLALFPALFEPVFSLLSISTSLPLPLWHCPLSSPRDFPGHSRTCGHCRWVVGLTFLRTAAGSTARAVSDTPIYQSEWQWC